MRPGNVVLPAMFGGDDSEAEALLSKPSTTSRRVGAGPSPSAQLATCIGAWFAASIGLTLGNKAAFSGASCGRGSQARDFRTAYELVPRRRRAQPAVSAPNHLLSHRHQGPAGAVPAYGCTPPALCHAHLCSVRPDCARRTRDRARHWSLQHVPPIRLCHHVHDHQVLVSALVDSRSGGAPFPTSLFTVVRVDRILVISVVLGLQQPRPVLVLVVASVAAGIVLAAAPAWEEVPAPPSGWPPPAPALAAADAADAGGTDSASSFDPARETRKALLWLAMDGDDATSVPLPFLRHALARHFGTARQAPPASPARATMWRGGLTHETTLGMLLVLAASVCGAFRWAWMELLLRPAATVRAATGDERRGDTAGSLATALQQPLSLVRATASLGFCTMLPIALWLETVSIVAAVKTHPDRDYTSGLLLRAGVASLAGGLLAFCMLLVELRIVQLASSLTLSVAGTLKEVLTVGASVLIFGDELTWRKAAGLTLCIAGIFCYNQIKGRREEGCPRDAVREYAAG